MRTANGNVRAAHLELLGKLLDTYGPQLTDRQHEAFTEMREGLTSGQWPTLTAKQRQWLDRVLEEHEPSYANAVSSGLVPRGREVEPPPSLRREALPMKPPGRR